MRRDSTPLLRTSQGVSHTFTATRHSCLDSHQNRHHGRRWCPCSASTSHGTAKRACTQRSHNSASGSSDHPPGLYRCPWYSGRPSTPQRGQARRSSFNWSCQPSIGIEPPNSLTTASTTGAAPASLPHVPARRPAALLDSPGGLLDSPATSATSAPAGESGGRAPRAHHAHQWYSGGAASPRSAAATIAPAVGR